MTSTPRSSQAICCTPCIDFSDDDDIVVGNAFDIIVVHSNDRFFSNEIFIATFPKRIEKRHRLFFEFGVENTELLTHEASENLSFELDFDGSFHDDMSFRQLARNLRPGRNPARYLLLDENTVVGVAYANVFLWSGEDKVVISDIDGTITKSNAGGIFDTILTERYRHCHDAVCFFFSSMVASKANLKVLYVTSRPISLAVQTRKFIDNLRQQGQSLPDGPVLGFLGGFPELLIMELVSKKTHKFKAEILWKHVVEPFRRAGLTHPFQAAFGNTYLDVQAYSMVAVPLTRTYLIKKQQIHSFDGYDGGDDDDDELMTLKLENQGTSTSWGSEMPREWYKRKMGSMFSGYADPRLQQHVMLF